MLLVAAALREEIAPLARVGWRALPPARVGRWPILRWQTSRGEVCAVATGVGHDACRDAVIQVDARLHPRAIVSTGLAGAAADSLVTGDIVISESIVIPGEGACSAPAWMLDLAREAMIGWQGRPWCFATSVMTPHVLPDSQSKRAGAAEHRAAWVDMESGAIGRLAVRFAIPWISVRVIDDALTDDLNDSFDAVRHADGRIAWAALARLASRPARLRRALELRRQTRAATRTLAGALALIVPRVLAEIETASAPQ